MSYKGTGDIMSFIYPFSEKGCTKDSAVWERVGRRGQRAFELAEMKLPIVPGFVLDSKCTAAIRKGRTKAKDLFRKGLPEIENGIGRKFGDPDNPLLLKVIVSSNLNLPIYPSVFNVGLSPDTIRGFAALMGARTAWFEYCYLLRTAGVKIHGIDEEKFNEIEKRHEATTEGTKACAEDMLALLGEDRCPSDPLAQLHRVVTDIAEAHCDDDMDEDDIPAIIVQGMVFGNLSEDSAVGIYTTRDTISGEGVLKGSFLKNAYTLDRDGEELDKLDEKLLEKFRKIGSMLERRFRELREVKFIAEKDKLWLINQTAVDNKSTQAHLRTLLDLLKAGEVEEKWLVGQIPPGQLATLLHPVIDPASLEGIETVSGGLAGAPGAAVGRIYFSADRLMEAHRDALQKGEDTRLIEGGYASHAPVVSRSVGKVCVINPDIRLSDNSFELEGQTVREGDYVTLDVPVYRDPVIALGKATLINPDIHTNGLVDLIEIIKKHVTPDFVVRANADLGRDAKVAKTMGASGIGLCRTEHMFFAEDRINRFREMILAADVSERLAALSDLAPFQRDDFYELFREMAPHPVTIRLLDAPLHEFLPRSSEAMDDYMKYLESKGLGTDRSNLNARIERLHEFNPMLGHRGCRVAVTYPEIYEMQVRAIFEAAVKLTKEGFEVKPEIKIPLIMNPNELTFIKNGKRIEGKEIKGIRDIAREVFKETGTTIDYRVGTMIELPAAALLSEDIARYAEFFSFGTNDLTQTTNGLSRDDINSFFPVYTEFDLLPNNPFQVLGNPVKELIKISSDRGRVTRPDLKLGLCGEHGADPENIAFCREAGLDYVSCSSYSVPISLLAVAQLNLNGTQ